MEGNEAMSMRKSKRNALREAVRNGAKTAISRLLGNSEKGQNSSHSVHLEAAFCNQLMAESIDKGHCFVVEILIHHGFDADGQHQDTPHLHRAITCGKEDIVRVLVHSGSDVTGQNHVTGKTSLHLAAASGISNSSDDILEFLILSSRQSNNERSHTGQLNSNFNRFTHFCDKNDRVNMHPKEHEPYSSGKKHVYQCEAKDALEDDKKNNFSEHSNDKINHRNGIGHRNHNHSVLSPNSDFLETKDRVQGNTALHAACAYNNERAALCLLHHGANPNPLNMHGDTPLAKLLQPITRKADDTHNRSRLNLARRLVAMGLVVEKKYNRGACINEKPNLSNTGYSGVRVTSGCGSASSKFFSVPGKTANCIDPEKGSRQSSETNENDLDESIEVERIYEEVKRENGSIFTKSEKKYTKALGVETCCNDMIKYGLVGVQDYGASSVRDRARQVGAVNIERRSDATTGLKLHQDQPSHEDIEAKLGALCIFDPESVPEDDPEVPSPPHDNILIPEPHALISSEYSRLVPKFESLVAQLSKHKNRGTDVKPDKAKHVENTTQLQIRRPDTCVVNQTVNEKCQSKLRLSLGCEGSGCNTHLQSVNKVVDSSPKNNRDVLSQNLKLGSRNLKPKSRSHSDDDVFQNEIDSNGDNSRISHITSSRSSHRKSRSNIYFQSSSTSKAQAIASDLQKSILETECSRPRHKSTPHSTHHSRTSDNSNNFVSSRNRSRALSKQIDENLETTAPRLSITKRPLREVKDTPPVKSPSAIRSETLRRNRENPQLQEVVQRNRDVQNQNPSAQRNREESRKDPVSTSHNMAGKFKFPSRDERIRLRFKRLLGELSATLTLQQLCRLTILRSLTGKSVAGSVDKLGLPTLMQKFLLRDDLY